MTPALEHRRRYCRKHPEAVVSLPAWELLELLDKLEDARRQRDACREHLERRHGCAGECGGVRAEKTPPGVDSS